MKIIAFGGSSSKQSINKKLAVYAASLFKNCEVEVLDLNDYELPLFSVDIEKEIGQPKLAKDFLDKIFSADLLVVSMAEHNRNYSTAFKNISDWASRIELNIFKDKPMLLMATSTGARGGASVLEISEKYFPRFGAKIIATFSLPSFEENFKEGEGIVNEELKNKLIEIIKKIQDEQL
ncbi:MAG: NAD(P)H-dependent oxidoreductase [Bacteroidota bacterium]|nr:NAD(P)H-dependent oxidoreductase [Bacteroidota bacterium]